MPVFPLLDTTIFKRASLNPPLLTRPLYLWKLIAGETTGFASPAQDYEQEELNLNDRYVTNRPATYFFQIGKDYDSMIDAGIMPGGIVIVDKSLKVKHRAVVVVGYHGEWLCKRLYMRNGVTKLLSENKEKNYAPLVMKEGEELYVFGVVKNVINDL